MINSTNHFTELRSEEIQELLTRPPKWLIRWGITIVLIIVSLIFLGAWLVHYPDTVQASFKLISTNAPRSVISRSNGKLVRLLVQDGQKIQQGAPLAFLESTASHEDILQLSNKLTNVWSVASRGNLEKLAQMKLSSYRQLGELQNAYEAFEQTNIQLRAYLSNGFYSRKKQLLQQEINDLLKIATNLKLQQQIQIQEIKLVEEDYNAQLQLARDKVIAPIEMRREESKYISRKLPYQQTESALINNLIAQRAKQKEVLELDQQINEARSMFLQSLNTLLSEIEVWKAKYIVTAPIQGRVFWINNPQENQNVTVNQELFNVNPFRNAYIGELWLPQQNVGKVKIGHQVIIRFVGYPYQEFGVVRGQIVSISNIPYKDSIYFAKVTLTNGLKTSYGKQLTYKTGMLASADIITDDNRLIEKIFYQLRKVVGGINK